MRNFRLAPLSYLAGLLLLLGASAAAAQTTAESAGTNMTVDEPTPLPQDTPTPVPTATATPTATTTPPPGVPKAKVEVPPSHADNAARRGGTPTQQTAAKAWEAKYRCLTNPSLMLAHGGTSPSAPPPRSYAWLAYVIFGTCLLLVAGGALVRWYRSRRPSAGGKEKIGLLEVVATIVGICAGVTGLVSWVAPDLVAHAEPPKQAEMTVQSVNARIRHDRFVKTESQRTALHGNDRREVGNVIWLDLHLLGYRGTKLRLQWGSFAQRALIAATTEYTTFTPPTDDVVQFQPVWVGYPNTQFRVELRLMLDKTGQVIQMAKTGEMNGKVPRYACRTA